MAQTHRSASDPDGTDDRSVLLRAERGGRLTGRAYTLTFEAEDWAGNVTEQSVEVRVPHDWRRDLRATGPRPSRRP